MQMEYFGDRLKALRTINNLTQAQLAKKLNMSVSVVSAYEQGLKYPSIEVLIKLCITLDTSSDYLLGLSNNMALEMGGLTDEQTQPFLQLISIVEQYNNLAEKAET